MSRIWSGRIDGWRKGFVENGGDFVLEVFDLEPTNLGKANAHTGVKSDLADGQWNAMILIDLCRDLGNGKVEKASVSCPDAS